MNHHRQKIAVVKKPEYPVGAALCGPLFGRPQRIPLLALKVVAPKGPPLPAEVPEEA